MNIDEKALAKVFKEVLLGHEWDFGYIAGKYKLVEDLVSAVKNDDQGICDTVPVD